MGTVFAGSRMKILTLILSAAVAVAQNSYYDNRKEAKNTWRVYDDHDYANEAENTWRDSNDENFKKAKNTWRVYDDHDYANEAENIWRGCAEITEKSSCPWPRCIWLAGASTECQDKELYDENMAKNTWRVYDDFDYAEAENTWRDCKDENQDCSLWKS